MKLETSAKTDHVLDRLAKFVAPSSINVSSANFDCISHRIRKALRLLEPEESQACQMADSESRSSSSLHSDVVLTSSREH
jgi:hypothetical protein